MDEQHDTHSSLRVQSADDEKITPVQSIIEEPAPIPPGPTSSPPPNGGTTAWLQVVGGWCIWFAAWGVILSFGLFQKYYQETYLKDYRPSDISWIGTVQACFAFLTGTFCGPLFDRGYLRSLLVIGTVLVSLGLFTASAAKHYYSIFLSLGLCTGVGMGCLWLSAITTVGSYFTTKRPLAGSLAATGAGFGTVLYSATFQPLVRSVGYPWTLRIIAFIDLAFMLAGLVILRQRPIPQKPRQLVDWSAFREARFNYFCAACVLMLAGLYVPFFYMTLYAQEKVGVSSKLSYDLISIMGAGSAIGRLVLGLGAVHFEMMTVLTTGSLVTGFMMFIWGSVYNLGGSFTFALFYGILSGGVAGLQPTAAQNLAPLHLLGTRSGMVLVFVATGVLIGNPIAGAILTSPAGFTGVQGFAGGIMLLGTACLFMSLLATRRHAVEQSQS